MENFKVVAKWHEREINTTETQTQLDAFTKKQKVRQTAIDTLLENNVAKAKLEARSHAADYLLAATVELIHKSLAAKATDDKTAGARVIEAEKFTRGTKAAVELDGYGKDIGILGSHGPANVEYDITMKEAGAYLLRVRYAAKDARPSKLFLNGALLKTDFAGQTTGTWYPDSQRYFDEGIHTFKAGVNTLKLDCPTPFPHIDKLMLVPVRQTRGLVQLLPANANALRGRFTRQWAAYLKKTAADTESPFANWHALVKTPDATKAKALVDKFQKQFAEAKEGSALHKILSDPKGPFATEGKPEEFLTKDEAAKLRQLRADLKKLEATKPKSARAMSLTEGEPEDLKVQLRGNYLNLGQDAPRGFLRVISEVPVKIQNKASGRLELARWMTWPEHPLTARVMANRIWLWHFGEGIVRSPDNFGKLGQRPTHPALLDWLTLRFTEQGWSIKKMHRLIMLSATYQMSSQQNETAEAKDPANQLWWRFNRRRLLAEEIRDSLLSIDGTLEHGLQQQLMTHKPREYVTATGYKNVNFDFRCRSVYMPVIRSAVYPVMTAFDFGDPAVIQGQRASTTVAPQALFMMNDKLVLNASQQVAACAMKATPPERMQQLYKQILRRPPTEPETKRALDFVQRLHDRLPSDTKDLDQRALQGLARVLFASNEFMYLD